MTPTGYVALLIFAITIVGVVLAAISDHFTQE